MKHISKCNQNEIKEYVHIKLLSNFIIYTKKSMNPLFRKRQVEKKNCISQQLTIYTCIYRYTYFNSSNENYNINVQHYFTTISTFITYKRNEIKYKTKLTKKKKKKH